MFYSELVSGLDKLSRFIKCLFVGYSKTQKEYRCYSPTNRKFLVSADGIIFDTLHKIQLLHQCISLFHRLFCCLHLLLFLMSLHHCHRHYRSTSTKVSSESQICLHSPTKNFYWISSGRLLSSGRFSSAISASLWSCYFYCFCKGKWSCTDHLISHFIFNGHLNLSFCQFVMSLSSNSIPRSYEKAILVPT